MINFHYEIQNCNKINTLSAKNRGTLWSLASPNIFREHTFSKIQNTLGGTRLEIENSMLRKFEKYTSQTQFLSFGGALAARGAHPPHLDYLMLSMFFCEGRMEPMMLLHVLTLIYWQTKEFKIKTLKQKINLMLANKISLLFDEPMRFFCEIWNRWC